MRLSFEPEAWKDYLSWSTDKETLKKLNRLLQDIQRTPFEGIGKPEPLKHTLAGHWSRRITEKDRLVYRVTEDAVIIVACRSHYGDS